MNNPVLRIVRRLPGYLVAGLVVMLFAGCATQSSPPAPAPSLMPVTSPVQTQPQAQDDFGASTCRDIAIDLSKHDAAALDAKLDLQLMLRQVFAALNSQMLTEEQRSKLEMQLKGQIKSKLIEDYDKDSWEMLKGRADGERYLCVLRTDLTEHGVSYVEFELRMLDGRMKIVDWVDLVQEQKVSELFSELFGDINAQMDASSTTVTRNWEIPSSLERLQYFEFLQAARSEDPNRVFRAYDNLPWRFKQKPLYGLLLVRAVAGRDDALYQKALKNMEQQFGAENHYGVLLIDLYVKEGRFAEAAQGLNKFRDRVDINDPVIEILLAILAQEQGHAESFYEHCLQAITINPDYERTYWVLLDQLVADRHYDDAVLVLHVLTKMFKFDLKALHFEADAKYRSFRQSEAFRAWAVSRA